MTSKTITKREQYNILTEVLGFAQANGYTLPEGVTYDTLVDFCAHEVELLDSKAASAKERAAKKREEGDALRETVYGVLSDTEAMTIDAIVSAINDPTVTRNMVTSRLGQLAKADRVEKDSVTTDDKRKIAAYRRK